MLVFFVHIYNYLCVLSIKVDELDLLLTSATSQMLGQQGVQQPSHSPNRSPSVYPCSSSPPMHRGPLYSTPKDFDKPCQTNFGPHCSHGFTIGSVSPGKIKVLTSVMILVVIFILLD